MKKIKNKAFTLIETMVALVIGMIAIGAMYFSYQYFNNAHQSITDRANISELGRNSLSMIAKDLKNAGYKNINYSRSAWDKKIEVKNNYNGQGADYLRIWYNSDQSTRMQAEYYIVKTGDQTNLVKKLIENPQFENRQVYCERSDTQKNCKPLVIVENVTDFQVVLKDINGGELTAVGLSSADAIANQDKVHTAEIYVTVRSANELYKANKITKILNHNFSLQKNDQYHRETFFLSVYLRNLIKI
ncbi:prepilin-type N-terminal cleavage/methylation domain-containing protein [bacterium]|jgi:prepilin-type N-terminal cleavage/methylation domain-containing protein|nr:prepilin-type N-terminal cleavage/methylation domain-containing protein [bacterium]